MASSANVERASSAVRTVLAVVGGGALVVLLVVWVLVRPSADTLAYELARVSLQVLAVSVLGGIVSFATARWQLAHQEAAADLQDKRKQDADEVERRRQEFQLKAALLDRSSRCAQKMYVTCQHVRRVQRDAAGRPPGEPDATSGGPGPLAVALDLLHRTYLDFSAEAAALETEFGARFGIVIAYDPSYELRTDLTGSGPRDAQNAVNQQLADQAGHPYLRWHQVSDLLTVYYFALCGNFRQNILWSNSMDRRGKFHSGIDFTLVIERARRTDGPDIRPTPEEAQIIMELIRDQFEVALPALARAALDETPRGV